MRHTSPEQPGQQLRSPQALVELVGPRERARLDGDVGLDAVPDENRIAEPGAEVAEGGQLRGEASQNSTGKTHRE